MAKASIGAGNVSITLNGEDCVLRPSLAAAQAISRREGGILSTIQAITRFDLDATVFVIANGLGRDQKEIAEKVWRTGISSLAPAAIRFCSILSNGGRPLDESIGGSGEENPPSA